MRSLRILLTVLILAGAASAQGSPSASPTPMTTAPHVLWPPLPDWRTERIPFPLDFAPTLAYTGYEELRFSPDFGKPDRPLFFTYGFLWVIPESIALERGAVERDLKVYFDGLMKSVAESKKLAAPVDTRVTLADPPPGPDGIKWVAAIETFDAFFTRKPLSLTMHVIPNVKVLPGWRVHYFEATTAPLKPEVLPTLQVLRASLSAAPVSTHKISTSP